MGNLIGDLVGESGKSCRGNRVERATEHRLYTLSKNPLSKAQLGKKQSNVLETKQIHVRGGFEAKMNKKLTTAFKTKQINVGGSFEANFDKKQTNVLKTKQIHVGGGGEAKMNKKQTNVLKTKQIHMGGGFEAKMNKKMHRKQSKFRWAAVLERG